MINYEVFDDFLDQQDFDNLSNTLLSSEFPLFLQKSINSYNKKGIYFTYVFKHWDKDGINCNNNIFNLLKPVLTKLNCKKLHRAQLNLHPQTFFKRYHAYHRDHPLPHKGCLLYLNTNNGNTIIKNGIIGKKFQSVANRALIFDPSIVHKSTTCTDMDFRALLVINYS